MDLAAVCRQVLDEARASHPNREVTLTLAGDLRGIWDEARLAQVLSNLVENAVQHGAEDAPVAVSAHGEGERVWLAVHNRGVPIPKAMLARIFVPLVASMPGESRGKAGSLGLGLYIAREIVLAHGGSVDVTSSEDAGTTFTVCLPSRS